MVALKTFENLPIERKVEIINACLEEFALHDYDVASLSNIVARLGLAKGSFYRYFDSKKSLYLFLLNHCIDTRIQHDAHIIDRGEQDFFELMVQHFAAKISYDKKFPLQSAFLFNVMNEKNNDELGNIQSDSRRKVLNVIKGMVAEWKKRGELRTDVDIDTMAFIVLNTQFSIFDYITITYGIDIRKNIRERRVLHDIPEDVLMNVCRQFVDLLKNGIAK
ncbi:MAG: TetR/AcrR family transcriptional regulator [Taibaiella sp.]|nr:TetR/AcrR family transcriptional regulator [Taibaiella sp.]